jgi:putative endonuclease
MIAMFAPARLLGDRSSSPAATTSFVPACYSRARTPAPSWAMAAHNDFGRAAERMAAELLERHGWTVLARNWRFRRKEIDLIVRRAGTVAFVEVRARSSTLRGHPLATIGWRKRRDLETAAQAWIGRHGRAGDVYRFDVVAVVGGDTADLPAASGRAEHLGDAWRL